MLMPNITRTSILEIIHSVEWSGVMESWSGVEVLHSVWLLWAICILCMHSLDIIIATVMARKSVQNFNFSGGA